MVDSDFASEPHSCGHKSEMSEDLKHQHTRAGLGVATKISIRLEWRDPDMSDIQNYMVLEATHPDMIVCCLRPLAIIQGCYSYR
jgi:hypothetical protein